MISWYYKIIKRLLDIILSLLGIIICTIPVTLGVIIAKLITRDFSPLFFCQKRFGKNGKVFKIIKFRSMVNEVPTKVGKFLREHSIDEGPQVINILLGQMSFIGPRPYMIEEREYIEQYMDRILSVTPGLAGPYQVYGRHKLSLEERINLDVNYTTNKITFKDDFKMFCLACKAPFKKEK